MVITHKSDIPDERVKSLLCSALEGGSNYWYMIEEHVFAPGLSEADFQEGGKYYDADWSSMLVYSLPFTEGCGLVFSCTEDEDDTKRYRLDRAALERGMQLMADKEFRHFSNFMLEDDDCETGDVFLQLCLFGEVVYS